MKKILFAVVVMSASLVLSACSERVAGVPVKQEIEKNKMTMHPEVKAREGEEKSGLAEAIKKKTLPAYPAMSIGKAFDSYSHFNKREWRETFVSKGKIYVDFIGWFDTKTLDPQNIKNGISAKGVEIKFVLNPDGPFYVGMASKLEVKTDGKIYAYPLADIKVVLDSIYANREITF